MLLDPREGGGEARTRTELQLHFLPRNMKDEIGPDVVGTNEIVWKPAGEAQGPGECTVMPLCNRQEAESHQSREESLTLALSQNIHLFFHLLIWSTNSAV